MTGDAVEVIQAKGRWIVRVTEDGETVERVFNVETFAESFAAGQRARLREEKAVSEKAEKKSHSPKGGRR